MHPEHQGYKSYTEHKQFPVWESNSGIPFKRKIGKWCDIYDSKHTYIKRWFD